MKKKKGSKQSKKAEIKEITSFSSIAQELNLQQSYKSLLLGIAVVLLFSVLVFGFVKKRNAHYATQEKKQIAVSSEKKQDILGVYTVSPGDDLKTISLKYFQTPEMYLAIAQANNITNPDVIEEGTKITVPKIDKTQLLGINAFVPDFNSTITENSYTVKEGDLLWDIAVRAYKDGTKWKDIAADNNLPSADSIFPGMILQIPR